MTRNRLKSTMHRLVVLAMFGAAPLLGSSGSAHAQSTSVAAPQSRTISYQGMLQKNGAAVPDGDYTVRLTLYSDATGTTKVWQGTYTVHTQNGVFNVLLGSGAYPFPAPASMDGALWLGTKIGDGPELPLTQVGASAFAMNVADNSITAKKMATDYVGSISVNGQKVTAPGGNLNLVGANGISLNVDPTTNSLYLSSSSAAGTNSGKGADPQSNVVHAITGTANQVSVDGSYTEAKTDSITLALPQDIATTSSPTFSDLTLNGLTHFSTPSAVAGILAVNASNQVGYRTPAEIFGSAANNWILNQTTQQTANFNISGNGTIGGTLNVGGASTFGGTLDMSGNSIQNVTDPANAQDAATKYYVDHASGNANYIQNGTSQQTANFNINGTGTAAHFNSANDYQIGGSTMLSGASGGIYLGLFAGPNSTGVYNTFAGYGSGYTNSTGYSNTFAGVLSGFSNTTGAENVFLGDRAGYSNTSGNANTFVGIYSGTNNTTGSDNATLGVGANVGSGNLTNATAIGANAVVNTSNSVVLGSGANVGIGTSSPLYKLHVVSSGIPNTVLEGTSDIGTWLSLGNTSTGGHWFDIISTGTNNSEGAGKLLFTRAVAPNVTAGEVLTLDWATSSATFGGNVDMSSHAINNVADPTNASDAATKGYVDSRAAGVIPIGGIIMWSGSVSNIPAGWALCDGNTYNGHATPNLTDRFIVGAGGSYAVGATGGSAQAHYTASGVLTTSSSTTGISVNAAHTGISLGSYGPYDVDESTSDFGGYLSNVYLNTYISSDPGHTHTINDPGHTHTVNASGITLSTTSSLPPYYAMAYIMRVQ